MSVKKIYLVLSLWSYPFGGGEDYMYQTLKWTHNIGMENYWISFTDSHNKPYEELDIINEEFYTSIKIPGGLDEDVLYYWLKIIKPDIVHHQGHHRKIFFDICQRLRIEFITGIHFWGGALQLNPEYGNIKIIENIDKHTIDPEFLELNKSKHCTIYSVSQFVTDCIEKKSGIKIENLVYSGSSPDKCFVPNNNILKNQYVTLINIHMLKGGNLLLYLLKELVNIPFLVVQTEHLSGDLDNKIYQSIVEKNNKSDLKSIYYNRLNSIAHVYAKTRIFLAPSIVDETFCRVINEANMNKIPVLTSGRGNTKYLMSDTSECEYILDPENYELWRDSIQKLYYDETALTIASEYSYSRYQKFNNELCKKMFIDLLESTMKKSKEYNIMIYCPWCDQGLGIQSKNYYHLLKKNGFNVFIFSFKPYNAENSIALQKKPEEWIVDGIYYSKYDREHVKDIELIEFIIKYNIGKCIIPETCWNRVFEICKLLDKYDIKSYAIPNIEIVRKDELFKHNYFYKILCNNYLCQNIFNKYGIDKTEYIGYGIYDNKIDFKPKRIGDKIKFLFIGGMNAFSRKHILEICEAFTIAYKTNQNIELTCTIQKTNDLESQDIQNLKIYLNHPGIVFIQSHLSYDDIINLYYQTSISIQVSKHEGLGLGFYESLQTGTPIITLDTPPHNEIIKDSINGWIIPCHHKKMTDNQDGLIESAYFNPQILADKIIEITNNKETLGNLFQKLINDYISRFDINLFINRFISSLN